MDQKIVINDEALAVIAKKVLDLNMAGDHDSLEEAGEKSETVAREIAKGLIEEYAQLNDKRHAELMQNFIPKPQISDTPMMDAVRHSRAVKMGDGKTAESLTEKINYGTTVAGGYFAPNENALEFLDLVNTDSNVLQYCRPPVNMKSNTMTIPTLTNDGLAYTVAEASSANAAALTAVNTTTGQLTLTAYKRGVYQISSAELFDDSDPAFEAVLRMAMIRSMSTSIDWGIFHGDNTAGASGTNDLFKGLEGDDVITTNKVNAGGTIDFDDILSARAKDQNTTKGAHTMFVNPSVQNQLVGVKDLDGRYIYNPDVRTGETAQIWGTPVIVNNRISSALGGGAESAAFYGAFGESAIIGRKPEVRFIVDWTTYAESTSVKLTVSTRIAFEVASEDHFALIHGITIT